MLRLSLNAKFALCFLFGLVIATGFMLRAAKNTVDTVIGEIEQQHYQIAVRDTHDAITHLMAIGLPLDAIRHVQDIIDQAKSRDPALNSLVVYDPAGKVLYSTDLGEIGTNVPENWSRAGSTHPTNAEWDLRLNDDLVIGYSLSNDFGTPAGTLVLHQTAAAADASPLQSWTLWTALAASALVATLTTILAVAAVLAPFGARLGALATGLSALLAEALGRETEIEPAHGIGEPFDRFRVRVRAIYTALSNIAVELKRLDDQA